MLNSNIAAKYGVQEVCWRDNDNLDNNVEAQSMELSGTTYRVIKNPHITIEGDTEHVDRMSGMKIWESSCDLVECLSRSSGRDEDWSKRKVYAFAQTRQKYKRLEIGCGHGLPGIFALKQGAEVHFQDYNPETLEQVTKINVSLNVGASHFKKAKFFSGEWTKFASAMAEPSRQQYDVICCAECVYNEEQFEPIITLIEKLLSPTGTAYISGKRFYFGCSGGTAAFLDAVQEKNNLIGDEVWASEDGQSNVREIVSVKMKT